MNTNKLVNTVEENILELVSGTEAIVKTKTKEYTKYIDALKDERFINRLNYFVFDDYADEASRKDFFQNIDREKKSMLVSLISKALDTTYDIQAFILSRMYKKMRDQELSYLDKVLFSNIDDKSTFSEQSIKKFISFGILTDQTIQETEDKTLTYGMDNSTKVNSRFAFGFTEYSFELAGYLDKYFEDGKEIIKKYKNPKMALILKNGR